MNKLLAAKNIQKSYKSGGKTIHILRGVNIELRKGESLAIIGASGAGKSTFLHLLGALDRPDDGIIILDGSDYQKMSEPELASLRNRRIGFIYQFHHLLPEFSALENVMIPGIIQGGAQIKSPSDLISYIWRIFRPTIKANLFADLRARAENLLAELGLAERTTHRPAKLSGGEQQRVALARALINNPDIVLADEPTGNLDLSTGDKVLEVILQNTVGKGKSLILVTHNPDLAARLGGIHLLKNGILQRQ
jgi:lipoprotein-releasing system ATP-binding protein